MGLIKKTLRGIYNFSDLTKKSNRTIYWVFVVIFPVITFLIYALLRDMYTPIWRMPGLPSKIRMFLGNQEIINWYLPYIILALISMILVLIKNKLRKYIALQLGIFLGFLVLTHYFVFNILSGFGILIIPITPISLFISFICILIFRRVRELEIYVQIFIIAIFIWLTGIIGLLLLKLNLFLIFLLCLVVFTSSSCFPLSILLVFLLLLRFLRENIFISVKNIVLSIILFPLGIFSYGSVLYATILKALDEYNKLSPNPPDCYIATVATKGHSNFVGSWQSSENITVNNQLKRLKYLELVMKSISEKFHKLFRGFYDNYGKRVASRIDSKYLADVSYFLLKPFEFVAIILLVIFPSHKKFVDRVYGK